MRAKIVMGLAVLWPLASWAGDSFDVKPGLWETSTSMSNMSGMPAAPAMPQIPEATLARMPAQQRAQVEAMMKGRGAAGPQTTVRSCMTKESLDRGALGQADKSCNWNLVSSTSTKQVIHDDPEHVKGTMAMASSEGAKNVGATVSFSMKWLGADCGDVKPAGAK